MIYLDHHATTPLDPVALEAMMPWLTTQFGNAHSTSHAMGRAAAAACDDALASIADRLDTDADSVIVTSGATESNNLAIDGVMRHPRQKRRHLITLATEHAAVLDPVHRLQRDGFRVTVLPVMTSGIDSGRIDLDRFAQSLDQDVALVSVMWANNEIGVIQPLKQIAELTHAAGGLFHCDASQAVGRLQVNLRDQDIDLLSASAHKFYGPKGVGLLAIGTQRRVRLRPLIEGGGQQHGLRSGTLNVAGLIGMATALRRCTESMGVDNARQAQLRRRLADQLTDAFPGIAFNGPPLDDDWSQGEPIDVRRLANNLNVSFSDVEGETLMAAAPEVAISSGSACSSVDPEPSHVLTAIGLSESRARRSVRFGLGRFTTKLEIDNAVEMLREAHRRVVK